MCHILSPDYLQSQSYFERHCGRLLVDRKLCQYIFGSIFIGNVAQSFKLLYTKDDEHGPTQISDVNPCAQEE